MRVTRASVYKSVLFITLGILLGWFSISPTPTHAQAGDNAICNSSTPPTGIKCSASFIDVTFLTGTDICAKIKTGIGLLPTVGGVIDARGVNPGTSQTCANSPWNGLTSPPPAYIYLPTGTITIPATWVLPDHTRIFGEGRGGTTSGTTLMAASGFTASTPMIQMGSSVCSGSTGVCFGISIEDLMLDGGNQSIIGILNNNAQELSYVNRVNLHDITGTGLQISGTQAQNSGPYSNITFSPGTSAVAATVCVQIRQVLDTRGVHGLTCTSDGTPNVAVLLDSNNNSIEDAHFEGFVDGIRVGSNHSATNNIFFNVTGGSGSGAMTNVIHIYSTNTVNDLVLFGIHQGSSGINPIQDDTNSTTLSEASVAEYVIGRTAGGTGLSRFTTSPNAVNWGVGGSAPTGSCKVGSLFSNTGGSGSTTTLYLCALVGGSPAWVAH
jgi:hypothetical protein